MDCLTVKNLVGFIHRRWWRWFYGVHFCNNPFTHLPMIFPFLLYIVMFHGFPSFHSTSNLFPSVRVSVPRPFGSPFSTCPLYLGWVSLSPKLFHTLPEDISKRYKTPVSCPNRGEERRRRRRRRRRERMMSICFTWVLNWLV